MLERRESCPISSGFRTASLSDPRTDQIVKMIATVADLTEKAQMIAGNTTMITGT